MHLKTAKERKRQIKHILRFDLPPRQHLFQDRSLLLHVYVEKHTKPTYRGKKGTVYKKLRMYYQKLVNNLTISLLKGLLFFERRSQDTNSQRLFIARNTILQVKSLGVENKKQRRTKRLPNPILDKVGHKQKNKKKQHLSN